MYDKDFINIKLTLSTIDRYIIRSSIFSEIENNLHRFDGKLLDAGCGKMPYKEYILNNSPLKEYIGLDIESALEYDTGIRPDYTWDGKKMPFDNDSFDCVFSTEVIEHVPDLESYLLECFRVLKPGGFIFFTTPFLWNLHEVPYDECRYTPFSLKRYFEKTGFENIDIKATGGWHAAMAQMLGLYVSKSLMRKSIKKILKVLALPIIKLLVKKDKSYETVDFHEGTMITGIVGTGIKP